MATKYETGIAYVLYVATEGGERVRVGGETSSSLEMSTETASLNSKDDYGWSSNLPTIKSWSIETENLLAIDAEGHVLLEDAFMSGTELEIEIRRASGTKWAGKCLVESLSYEFAVDGVASFSASLLGQGALNPLLTPDAPIA